MSDSLLYYYCGGGPSAVQELQVSLFSLIRSNPKPPFQIGLALDRPAADLFDSATAASRYGVQVKVLERVESAPSAVSHAEHVINRWRGLAHFDYARVLILDIDTIVNRSLDPLFSSIHPDPEYFTTFVSVAKKATFRVKHRRAYDSVTKAYEPPSLYCSIGLHAISKGWPHIEQVVSYCGAIDAFRRRERMRRVFVEEYALNLLLMQNGRKVHFPFVAMRGSRQIPRRRAPPHVWHFLLNRCRRNALWRQTLALACEEDFLGSQEVVRASQSRCQLSKPPL